MAETDRPNCPKCDSPLEAEPTDPTGRFPGSEGGVVRCTNEDCDYVAE